MFAPELIKRRQVIHAPPKKSRSYPANWLDFATTITFAFEGSGYGQVSGNFDGQGLSVGGLQWNYGQGSLQNKILKPFIDKYGTDALDAYFPLGTSVSSSAYMPPKQAVSFSKKMQTSKLTMKGRRWRVKEDWARCWRKFLLTDEVINLQKKACDTVASKAMHYCDQYGLRSLKSFCFFFDVVTQNGSMNGVQIPKFDRSAYLETVAQEGDSNAFQWSIKAVDNEGMSLWMLIFARAKHNKWRSDVLMRKGTIAHGHGLVHGKNFDFTSWFTSVATISAMEPKRFEFDGNVVEAMFYDGNNSLLLNKWLSEYPVSVEGLTSLESSRDLVAGTYLMAKKNAKVIRMDKQSFESNYRLLQ